MRRFLAICLSLLVLSACGGRASSAVTCTQQYWDGTVGTCLPTGWSVVPHETLTQRGMPPEVITAFQRDKQISGQTLIVVVTQETLPQDLTAKTYSDASMRSVSGLPGYKLIDSRVQKVDGQDTQIHIYSAQPSSTEPERRFYQLSTAKKGTGFTYTGIAPLSVDSTVEKEILLILQNATLMQQGSSSSK